MCHIMNLKQVVFLFGRENYGALLKLSIYYE